VVYTTAALAFIAEALRFVASDEVDWFSGPEKY